VIGALTRARPTVPRLAPAAPRDAARLARILGDWVRDTPWMPQLHDRAEDRAFLARLIREAEVLTLRDRGGVLGFMVLDGEEVQALYLAHGARGRGHGKRLLDAAKDKRNRLRLWAFQANDAARRFYAREGFVPVRFTNGEDNDEGLPDVRLVWQREGTA
jgi:GNAT superfamily N-acetyltransferase